MDGRQFDALSRSVASARTRRGVLRLLSAIPLLGVLLALVADEQASAKRRRKSRQRQGNARHDAQADHHNRGQGHNKQRKRNNNSSRKKKRKQPCQPRSAAQTCSGRCGRVANECGDTIDCGPCDCGACPACQICDATTGHCRANPEFLGQACGAPGQVCQQNGACACDAGSCLEGQHCNGIACLCDAESCPIGCCDRTHVCRINEDAACGTGGGVCNECEDQCVDGACTCARSCPPCQSCNPATGLCRPDETTEGDPCGAGEHCLGGQCVCDATSCPTGCCQGSVCHVADAGFCGSGGGICTACATPGQACQAGACCAMEGSAASASAPCCAGLTQCANGVCRANCCAGVTCPSSTCLAPGECDPRTGNCSAPQPANDGAACDDGDSCTTGSTCMGGVCGNGSTICTVRSECYEVAGATCEDGECTYLPSTSGAFCGSVACGRCDGSGTCTGCQAGYRCVGITCCTDGSSSGAACAVDSDCCPCAGSSCSVTCFNGQCLESDIG